MDMSLTTYRNKNHGKTAIDWDLNIFIPEEFNPDAEHSDDQYYFDPTSWKIHVYIVNNHGHEEWDEPIDLTCDEIRNLGLNRDPYFKDEVDTWYGLSEFKLAYWSKMSDRLKLYFDGLPRYTEDVI
jgi:hypothetical protein